MMSPYDAAKAVKKVEPSRTPTYVCDYDSSTYVVTALLNPKKPEYSDPFWSVDKKTGKVSRFSPASDLERFGEAMNKRGHEIRGI